MVITQGPGSEVRALYEDVKINCFLLHSSWWRLWDTSHTPLLRVIPPCNNINAVDITVDLMSSPSTKYMKTSQRMCDGPHVIVNLPSFLYTNLANASPGLKKIIQQDLSNKYIFRIFFSSPRLVKRLGEHKDYAWLHDRAHLLFLHTSLHLDARTRLCLGEKKSKRLWTSTPHPSAAPDRALYGWKWSKN